MNKPFIVISIMLFMLAGMASASSVTISSAFGNTISSSSTINDGETAEILVSANSVLEPNMNIKVELIASTGQTTLLLEANTPHQSYATNYFITKSIYGIAGDYTIRSTVTAQSGSQSTSSLTMHILPLVPGNQKPQFTSTPITTINEGAYYLYRANATDPDGSPVTYSLSLAPSWLSINSATGVVSGTAPQVAGDYHYAATITATDGTYNVTQNFGIKVIDATAQTSSVAATLSYHNTSETNTTIIDGSSIRFTASANSVFEDEMTIAVDLISADGNPTNLYTATTQNDVFIQQYTITNSMYQVGNYTIREVVSGASGSSATSTLTLRVDPAQLPNITNQTNETENAAPIINSEPVITISSGAIYSYQVLADDPENDSLIFMVVEAPTWLSMHPSSGVLSGRAPNVTANTSIPLTIGVSDPTHLTTQTFILTIEAEAIVPQPQTPLVNALLKFTDTIDRNQTVQNSTSPGIIINATSLNETYMTISVDLYDADNNLLSDLFFSNTTANSYTIGISVPSSIYQLSGDYTLIETVRGASGTTAESQLTFQAIAAIVNVTNLTTNDTITNDTNVSDANISNNTAPIISSIPVIIVNEEANYSYQVIAQDNDADQILYSIFGPVWLAISSSGLVSGNAPDVNADTQYDVIINASDGMNTTSQEYTLTVIDIAELIIIVDANTTIGPAPLTINFSVNATGEAPFDYEWDFDNDAIIDSTITNPIFTYTLPGNYTCTITVTDAIGSSSNSSLQITVLPAITPNITNVTNETNVTDMTNNTAPIINSIPVMTTTEGIPYSYQLVASDAQGDNLTYAISGPAWLGISQTGLVSGTAAQVASDTTFEVSITVNDGRNATSQNYTLTVLDTAFFTMVSASPLEGTTPLIVYFASNVTGLGPFTYAWDFNSDGSIDSTIANPTGRYNQPGTYTATLRVTDPAGAQTLSFVSINAVDPASALNLTQQAPFTGTIREDSPTVERTTIEGIYFEEKVLAGDYLEMQVNTNSPFSTRGSVTIIIPELDIYQRHGLFDMMAGRASSKFLLQIPADAIPGTYDVKITVYQDGQERVKYRQIDVI